MKKLLTLIAFVIYCLVTVYVGQWLLTREPGQSFATGDIMSGRYSR